MNSNDAPNLCSATFRRLSNGIKRYLAAAPSKRACVLAALSGSEGEIRKPSVRPKRKGPPKRALHPATEAAGGTVVRLWPPLTTTTAPQ